MQSSSTYEENLDSRVSLKKFYAKSFPDLLEIPDEYFRFLSEYCHMFCDKVPEEAFEFYKKFYTIEQLNAPCDFKNIEEIYTPGSLLKTNPLGEINDCHNCVNQHKYYVRNAVREYCKEKGIEMPCMDIFDYNNHCGRFNDVQ